MFKVLIIIIASYLFLFGFSCSKEEPIVEPILPKISVIDLKKQRDNENPTTFRFNMNISPASSEEIKIDYTTKDGTAKAETDYTAVEGTLTIPAGQTFAYVDVYVRGDSLRQAEQTFSLELSNPFNVEISGTGKATATILNDGTYLPVNNTGYSTPLNYDGMNLVWNEDFEGQELDLTSWTYELGGNGWGNNELQYYTNSYKNSFISEGFLVIEARKENYNSKEYTSARIISKDKKTFTYGRMDIRAQLPKGRGIWPALWMLGNNISQVSWPACGEIDIMELLGHEPSKVYGTMHWGPAGGGSTHIGGNYILNSGNFADSFHVFSLLWEADKLTFMVDDNIYYTGNKDQVTGDYPFDKPFFFIMNVAVGGNWPGSPDATTVFPQRMIIDYIRVFQP